MRLTRDVTLDQAYPSAVATRWVEPESIDVADIRDIPLAPECENLAVASHRSRCGETAIVCEPLYWPDQNLLLSPRREVIVPANHGRIRPEHLDLRPFFDRRKTRLAGLYTSLRSFRWSYYQTLVDQLPMLFVLGQAVANMDRPIRLVFLPPLSPFEEHFVVPRLPPGVELYPVERGRTYELEEYVYASFLSHRYSGFLPSVYLNDFLHSFCPPRPRRRDRLVYVSRARATKGRRVRIESEVLAVLEPLGFESFALEELPVSDQIELFYDARCVVGPHGAGLTNLFFCDDADVFELFGEPVVWPHYYFICKTRRLRYHHQCGAARGRHDDFEVDAEALEQRVRVALCTRSL